MKIKQGKGLLAQIHWVNSSKFRSRNPLTGRFVKRNYIMGIDPYEQHSSVQVIYTVIDGMNKLNEVFKKDENNN